MAGRSSGSERPATFTHSHIRSPTQRLSCTAERGCGNLAKRYAPCLRTSLRVSARAQASATRPLQGCFLRRAPALAMSRARALYNFPAAQPGDLPLTAGDVVVVLQQMEGGWLEGELRGQRGIFPANYVEILPGEAPPVPQRAHRPAPPLPTGAATKVPAAQAAPPAPPPVAPDARVAFVPAASRGPSLPAGYVPPPQKELKAAAELGPIRILLLGMVY